MTPDLALISRAFNITGEFLDARQHGTGHVNQTYRVMIRRGDTPVTYIIQRINERIFRDPPAVMENIGRVTAHLRRKAAARGQDDGRHCLSFLPATGGLLYHRDEQGGYWRACRFIGQTRAWDQAPGEMVAREAARAFGRFQRDLADLPGGRLHETIPGFHDTPRRFRRLEEVLAQAPRARVERARGEIAFALARRDDVTRLADLARRGTLAERTVHNDTKINNLLFDEQSGEALCIIDLDTVGPGLVHYDFGDLVRTATSPVAEDAAAARARMRFAMYEALLRGYLGETGQFLDPAEIACLPLGGKLVTFEQGIRFLTDYLEGDRYYGAARPEHNLERARNQFRLTFSIERQMPRMEALLRAVTPPGQAGG